MMKKEYPKALYLSGWDDLGACVVVLDAEEESSARKDGYRMLTEQAGRKRPLNAAVRLSNDNCKRTH